MKAGFFLVELLVYITLSCLFFSLLFQAVSSKYNSNRQLVTVNSARSLACMAIDLITHDIRQSSTNQFYWRVKNSNTFIYRQEQTHIGWAQEGNKLYRIVGIYNQKTNTWAKKTKSLAASNIKRFHVEYGPGLKIVFVTLETIILSTSFTLHKSIAPRNGLVTL